MLKFVNSSNIFVDDIVYDVNHKTFDNFIFDPNSIRYDKEYIFALDDIIFSIAKCMKCNDANIVITNLTAIFDTCNLYMERYIRSMYYRNNRIEYDFWFKYYINKIR